MTPLADSDQAGLYINRELVSRAAEAITNSNRESLAAHGVSLEEWASGHDMHLEFYEEDGRHMLRTTWTPKQNPTTTSMTPLPLKPEDVDRHWNSDIAAEWAHRIAMYGADISSTPTLEQAREMWLSCRNLKLWLDSLKEGRQ